MGGKLVENNYEVKADHTIVYFCRLDGEILQVLIDTEDLQKVKSFKDLWGATLVNGKKWLIKGSYRDNKIKVELTLSRFILGIIDKRPVRFKNKNQLDHQKNNLTVGYDEVQIKKGNRYEVCGEEVNIILNRRDGSSLSTSIDLEDLQRVLDKGT